MKQYTPLTIVATVIVGCSSASSLEDGGPGIDALPQDSAAHVDHCTPGSTQPRSCGNCGLAQQVCDESGRWAAPGPCIAEGCAPGSVESDETPMCGMRTRICRATCEWSPWDYSAEDGVCIPGSQISDDIEICRLGEQAVRRCNDECQWDGPECVDLCDGEARSEPWQAEELCVPAGDFIRGSTLTDSTQPISHVYLDSFLIGRYPVSNSRYSECVDSGHCTLPSTDAGIESFERDDRQDYPVQGVTALQAEAFCLWDGGRRLPTEAEWEKAARGPAPSENRYPWGNLFDCTRLFVSSEECAWPESLPLMIPEELGAVPQLASPYGVDMLVGFGIEWMSDGYEASYYNDPHSLINPTGVDESGRRSRRGSVRGHSIDALYDVTRRNESAPADFAFLATIRCARSARSNR